MEISAAAALTFVSTECNITATPAVDSSKVVEILEVCKMPDDDGLIITDDLWEESYDLNQACALVWEYRMGLCFNHFDVGAGPNKQSRSQLIKHCKQMAQIYRSRRATSFPPGAIDPVAAAQPLNVLNP